MCGYGILRWKSPAEFLGLDPLHVANESKLVTICAPEVDHWLMADLRRMEPSFESWIERLLTTAAKGSFGHEAAGDERQVSGLADVERLDALNRSLTNVGRWLNAAVDSKRSFSLTNSRRESRRTESAMIALRSNVRAVDCLGAR